MPCWTTLIAKRRIRFVSRSRVMITALAFLGALALAVALVLPQRFAHPYWSALLFLILQPIPIFAAGVFAYRKAPDHPTARRLLIGASLYGLSLGGESVMGALYVQTGVFPGMWLLDLAVTTADLLAILVVARLFGLFPEGRYRSRHERVILGALWLLAAAPLIDVMGGTTLPFPENLFLIAPRLPSPWNLPLFASLAPVATFVYQGRIQILLVGLALLLLRYRRASAEQRLQIKWVLYAFGLMVWLQLVVAVVRVSEAVSGSTLDLVAPYFSDPILTVTLAATVLALFRHRLLDVDLVIRRSLVYGALWLLIGAGYVGVATALGIAAGSRLPLVGAILLTIAATIVFRPLQRQGERIVGRLVYGERLTGYEFLTRFGETLEHAFDVGKLAPRIAAAVRQGLQLRWARVLLDSSAEGGPLEPAGAAGIGLLENARPEVVVPLTYAGIRLGAIECGAKAEGNFSDADHELLATIARQAALGIHNGRLANELAGRLDLIRRQAEELLASRARIVQAQDTERRRIERNIHDGVQQEMVALIASLRLARNQLGRHPELADATLAGLQREATQALEDLRDLAQGIHPSVLTDRGLLEAVEAKASRVPIAISIDADPDLRGVRYAEEIEGAAYFLISEGLANALKHASASNLVVRLISTQGQLRVEVLDDGKGFVPTNATGSGLTGLRDRIEAVGGTVDVLSEPGKGTHLIGRLTARSREPNRV